MALENLELQLEKQEKKSRLIIRDDLYEISKLQEIFERASRRKLKIYLLDTGQLSPEHLEFLSAFRFSFYTSDAARPDYEELGLLNRLLKPEGSRMYYFIDGDLDRSSQLFDNLELFDSIFISSREKARSFELLASLAEEISRSHSNLVYYHHKNMEENLAEICLKNCWLHISSKNFTEEAEIMIMDLLKKARKNRGHLIIHVEEIRPYAFLRILTENGAHLVFNLNPVGRSQRAYRLISTWEKKKLPEKAFYLYKEVMA